MAITFWPQLSVLRNVVLKDYKEPENIIQTTTGSVEVVRTGSGLQKITLTGDIALTWTLNNGEKIQLYLTPAGFNVTDWGVTHWMTDVPTLATENMIIVEKVGGNIYAWDGGSR